MSVALWVVFWVLAVLVGSLIFSLLIAALMRAGGAAESSSPPPGVPEASHGPTADEPDEDADDSKSA